MFVIVFYALPLALSFTERRLFFIRAFEPCVGGSLLSSFEFETTMWLLAGGRFATPEV